MKMVSANEYRVPAKDRTGSTGQDLIIRLAGVGDTMEGKVGLSLGHGTYWVDPADLQHALAGSFRNVKQAQG